MHRPGPDEWMKLLEEYATSGLSQKEFVAKHELSFSTFQYWLYRKSKGLRAESGSSAQFVPVEVVPSPALQARAAEPVVAGGLIELELPTGLRVRLPAGTTPRFLGDVLACLR